MDLLEIRKKAKKAKESKGKVSQKKKPKKTEGESVEASKVEFQKEGPEESINEGPDLQMESVDADKQEGPYSLDISDDGGTEGFMDALYQKGDEEDDEEKLELLCFMLSDEEYAVDINEVKEIIKLAEITEVPKTPDFMLGIISLRGLIVPLLDLRVRLKLEANDLGPKVRTIIVSVGENSMGMLVDEVTEVVRLNKDALENTPAMLTNIDAELLRGVCRCEDRLLIVPNLSKVFEITI